MTIRGAQGGGVVAARLKDAAGAAGARTNACASALGTPSQAAATSWHRARSQPGQDPSGPPRTPGNSLADTASPARSLHRR